MPADPKQAPPPLEAERDAPGQTEINPTGVSTEAPAEGDDAEPEPDPGSPQG